MGQHTSARNGFVWAAALSAVVWVPVAVGQVAAPAATPPVAPPVAAAIAPAAAGAPVPTVAAVSPAVVEIQSDLAQKQYAAAIRLASKLLALRGDAASGFSRFQVTMLKGDAQAGAHALAAARTTYHDAIRETPDPHEKALATWTVELFRQAKGTTYVPHMAAAAGAPANGPIDLLDPDSRKTAFAALLDDQLSILGPKLKEAAGSPSLPQILPVVKQVQSLAELDEIASGTDARTSAAAGALLDHARNLMSNALKGMWTRTGDIYSSATQVVTSNGGAVLVNGQAVQQTITSQNGLTTSNANELRAMIDTCGKIRDAATVFAPLSHGTDDKDWGAILNDATRVAGRARDVLTANYSSPTANNQYPTDGTGYSNGAIVNGNVYYPPGTSGNYSGSFPGNNGSVYPHQPVGGGTTAGTGSTTTPPPAGSGGSTGPATPTAPAAPTAPARPGPHSGGSPGNGSPGGRPKGNNAFAQD